MEKVLFVGFGAIGAMFASRFQDADYPFQILCDEKRRERYLARQFAINGKSRSFTFVVPPEVCEAPDFILLSVKEYDLHAALDLLDGVIGPDTVVLSLLNGIGSEEAIDARFGKGCGLPAFVAKTDATRDERGVNFTIPGTIIFGENDGTTSDRVRRVSGMFESAGVNHQVSGEIRKMMWWKFMANVGINQTGAILGAPYGSFQHCLPCREAAISAMREVVALAPHYDVDLTENDLHLALEMVDGLDPEGKNSMVQDVEAGRKTEVDTFAGQVFRMGLETGVSTPVNRLYYQMLQTLEWQRDRTR